MAQTPPHCGMGAAGQGVDEKGGGQTETSWTQLPKMHRTLGLVCVCVCVCVRWGGGGLVVIPCPRFGIRVHRIQRSGHRSIKPLAPMATHPNTREYCSALCCAHKHFPENGREAVQSPPSDLQYTFLPLSRPAQGPVLLQPLYPFTQ